MHPQTLPQVYGAVAWTYVQRGWEGVLPLPPGAKTEPPKGFTGETGRYPTQAEVSRWASSCAAGNVALRLPDNALGLDVDAYEGKKGAQTLAELEGQLGALPQTWVSTSREDGSGSGIRIFRVPSGLVWRSDIGSDIDVIRRSWRYAVVWPSTHPKTRGTYRWYAPGWIPAVTPPSPADLAELPFSWVQFLTEVPETKRVKSSKSVNRLKSDDFFEPPIPIIEANRRIRGRLDAVTDHARRGWAGFRDTLRDSSYDIGGFVGGGHLSYEEAQQALAQAIVYAGHFPDKDDLLWIQQGLDDGASLAWKVAKPKPVMPSPKEAVDEDKPAGKKPRRLPLIKNSTWERRSWLRAIRDRANEVAAVPDATLGATLAIYAASVPHRVKIRTGIQYDLGLSILIGTVSGSGLGKSSGWKLARREFGPIDAPGVKTNPTGEGIAEELMGYVTETNPINGKEFQKHKQVRHNALFTIGEGEAMSIAMERSGSTLGATLRSLFSDEDLGTAAASADRHRNIPAGNYTIGAVVLYQETTAMKIINDTDTGTAQRFLWFSGHSPSTAPSGVTQVPRLVSPHVTSLEQEDWPDGTQGYVLRVEPAITARLRAEDAAKRDAYSLGDVNRDSQRPAVVAKVAGLACLIEGRTLITEDDWSLAEEIYAASRAIQDELIEFAEEQDRAKRKEAAAKAGEADHVRKSFRTEVDKTARSLFEKVASLGRPVTRRELARSVSAKRRAYLAEALEMAVLERGWLAEKDGKFEVGPNPHE